MPKDTPKPLDETDMYPRSRVRQLITSTEMGADKEITAEAKNLELKQNI